MGVIVSFNGDSILLWHTGECYVTTVALWLCSDSLPWHKTGVQNDMVWFPSSLQIFPHYLMSAEASPQGLIWVISVFGSRVVQKNLVFVVGLSHRLADPEVLKKAEYFGKFGKMHKVVINHSTSYAGAQVSRAVRTHHRYCHGVFYPFSTNIPNGCSPCLVVTCQLKITPSLNCDPVFCWLLWSSQDQTLLALIPVHILNSNETWLKIFEIIDYDHYWLAWIDLFAKPPAVLHA